MKTWTKNLYRERGHEASKVRLNRRGRLARSVLIFGIGLSALLGITNATQSQGYLRDESNVRPVASSHYIVKPGDRVWSIATRFGDGDLRPLIDEISNLNSLKGRSLVPGEVLALPADLRQG